MEKYLDILSRKTPFDSFVSKRFRRETFDLPQVREPLDKLVFDLIKKMKINKENQIVTVIGESGAGKTHFFWVLSNSINPKRPEFYIAYVSPQDTKINDIYFTLCTNILVDLGKKTLDLIASKIINIGGGKTTSLDMLGLIQVKKSPRTIIKQVLEKIELSEFQQNLMKVFIYLGSGTTFEKEIALKWLKKEELKAKELKKLDIKSNDFTEVEYEEILILITKYIEKPLVIFFDDVEYFQLLGKEEELAVLIKKLFTDLKSVFMILTSLPGSWNYFKSMIETTLEMDLPNIETLKNLTEEQIKDFYLKSMEKFWYKNGLKIPPDSFRLFPLDEKSLKIIFLRSRGNPRLVKQHIKSAIDQELYEKQVESLWELKEIIES